MRIGADRPGAWVCKVYLDGSEVSQCSFADEETGEVRRYVADGMGNVQPDPDNPG